MREQIMGFLNKKIERFHVEKKMETNDQRILEGHFPPFASVTSIYNSKIRIYRNTIIILIAATVVVFSIEEYRLHKALKSILNKEWLVIPGATNFMKVRPGEISDDVLFSFSDWIVRQLETFDYMNVDEQYHELEKYMSPEMRVKFSLEKKQKIEKYKKLGVVQFISFSKPSQIYQKNNDSGDSYYEATYRGSIQRYSNDEKLKPISEVITVKFTTSSLDNTNRKWFFNCIDIQRQYSEPEDIGNTQQLIQEKRG